MYISVIIPTYKPGKYIWDCLDSLNRQELSESTFEVLIILNGCGEPYSTRLEEYIRSLSSDNFKLIITEEAGVSNARNTGIEISKGDFICFIDDDDYLSTNYLSDLTKHIGNADIVQSNVQLIDDSSKKTIDYFLTDSFNICQKRNYQNIWNQRSFLSNACCKLISRNLIGDYRFNSKFTLGEDSLFMFEISKNLQKINLSSPEAVYFVRKRTESASRSTIPYTKKANILNRLLIAYFQIWIKNPMEYNFPFFLSRIGATLFKYFLKDYR